MSQTPIAVIGMSCRLPGDSNSPESFWKLLVDGRVADTNPPSTRFGLDGHFDGTRRPFTMRSPGGMFTSADPRDVDAGFFGLSHVDAVSMDPQQRQLLEVVYEGLENAGLSLEAVRSKLFSCIVGSYASDYSDIQTRDPEDRTPSYTVGSGRAMMSNRISHFLDIRGPSMTIDTACSGSLISVDLACRYLDTGDADGAIVAGSNLYMSPEHNMDQHAMTSAASPSGRCWTFDARADGYIKAEATNCLVLKRLDDAVRDGDPIRAVIRGTSTNSDGWTPGIASPSAEAQAVAIRRAYARAGISNLADTTYLECHGTGTLAGDPIECRAASSVFSKVRRPESGPLRIGSVKSNIGHSEPAAGISGMLKTILAVERGIIPGNPTFEKPNPNIDFAGFGILASKAATPWPAGMMRRASVNSFGYGGSNAHAIVEHPSVLLPGYQSRLVTSYSAVDDLFDDDDEEDNTRRLLVFSANDETSLKAYVGEAIRHLANPAVKIDSADLAYTLSERRTRHFHRGYAVVDGPCSLLRANQVVYGKRGPTPSIGFVFTGQGAQWPQMGRELLDRYPKTARETIRRLDEALQSLPEGVAPDWRLETELTETRSPEHMRKPEFSQPLVTALQLALLAVLESWGVVPDSVVGHSSGEIAAAIASGRLTAEDGIRVAYFRGKAARDIQEKGQAEQKLGMLAVGVGPDDCHKYLESHPDVRVACRNSPKSATLAGRTEELQMLEAEIKADGHFARLLLVDLAYHSEYMASISQHYRRLLETHCQGLSSMNKSDIGFFSTVYGHRRGQSPTDVDYWVANMMSPVLFDRGLSALVKESGPAHLIELGPSGALAGPIKQILQSLDSTATVSYAETLRRGQDSTRSLYELAGKLFLAGVDGINMLRVNDIEASQVKTVIDLPNYQWNHSIKYWHESLASKDWRYRPFPIHDLLGTKILGTSWSNPSWRRTLRLKNVPWIRDHTLGTDVVFPASGYVAMAVEAVFQMAKASGAYEESLPQLESVRQASYRMRDVRLLRALVVEEDSGEHIYCFLNPTHGQTKNTWYNFKISSLKDDVWTEHCTGMIRIGRPDKRVSRPEPLTHPTPARLWYKSMQSVGFNFGPTFQNLAEVETVAGQRTSRARINFPERTDKESPYAIHPSVFDTFFQAGIPSLYQGDRTKIQSALVPQLIDEIVINPSEETVSSALADTNSVFTTGRPDKVQNYVSNVTVHNEAGGVLAQVRGLHYTELDIPDAALGKPSTMCPMRVSWEPDVSLLDNDALSYDLSQQNDIEVLASGLRLPRSAARLVSLVKHKLSVPSVLDLDMVTERHDDLLSEEVDSTSLSSHLSTMSRYVSTSTAIERMMDAQNRFQDIPGTEFHIFDAASSAGAPPFETDNKFDLVILRMPASEENVLLAAVKRAKGLCADDGYVVLVHDRSLDGSDSGYSGSESESTAIVSWKNAEPVEALRDAGLAIKARSSPDADASGTTTVYLCTHITSAASTDFSIVTVPGVSLPSDTLIQSLKDSGWNGDMVDMSAATDLPLLFVDDPDAPLLANISETSWEGLKRLVTSGKDLLWLTAGSQLSTPSPSNALVHGFARSLRGEDSTLSLVTLDMSSLDDAPLIARCISQVMATFTPDTESSSTQTRRPRENEYAETNGVLHVSRVLKDETLGGIMAERKPGATALREAPLRANPRTVRLHCERVGAMDSIHFNEIPDETIPSLGAGDVEVEIRAAGLNYKDIATSLGLVPENEHLLGLEGAGVIRQVGSGVSGGYRVGDRVLVHGKGSFANRVRVPEENVFALPDGVSFKEAATMSIVYFTAVYSLMEVANLKKGQSVLIHSAAGGVGLASLQVCKYLGAGTIYATAGSEEKRRFLSEHHGIPPENIFSSRDSDFASGIRELTGGKGVDVVLNFLTGDLLDESWRLVADNGTLLEIGKKDIVDRNTLSMEPFDRNCSFRGIDISRPSILDDLPLVKRILQTVRQLLVEGHIKPISPMTVFSFSQIPDAMRYMRSGEHMGKIVIADDGEVEDVLVPIRAAPNTLSLDPEASYLVVGGLRGLCGSLAVYLARSGARHLTIMSRSGGQDERSQRVIRDLEALGARVQIAQGDVSSLDDTMRVFKESNRPIKGAIQGAMVLRVRQLFCFYIQSKLTLLGQNRRGHDSRGIQRGPGLQARRHMEPAQSSRVLCPQTLLLHHAFIHLGRRRHCGPGQLCRRQQLPGRHGTL